MGNSSNYPYNYNNTMLHNNPRDSHQGQKSIRFGDKSEIMVGSPNMRHSNFMSNDGHGPNGMAYGHEMQKPQLKNINHYDNTYAFNYQKEPLELTPFAPSNDRNSRWAWSIHAMAVVFWIMFFVSFVINMVFNRFLDQGLCVLYLMWYY